MVAKAMPSMKISVSVFNHSSESLNVESTFHRDILNTNVHAALLPKRDFNKLGSAFCAFMNQKQKSFFIGAAFALK